MTDFNSERLNIFNSIVMTLPYNSTNAQRKRLLMAFERLGSFTHYEAQRFLVIASPSKRLEELCSRSGLLLYREWKTPNGITTPPHRTKQYTFLVFKEGGVK